MFSKLDGVEVSRVPYEKMTRGQLILEYASKCAWHQCDGVKAMALAGKVSETALRNAMLDYRKAAEKDDWNSAEDALVSIAE